MNPFHEQAPKIEASYESFSELYPTPYDSQSVDPYTKCRIILMNGTEFEAAKFSHQAQRHIGNSDLRRALALSRRSEQQQQKRLANLKPIRESILEHTISYEQLAVDLTAHLAQRVACPQAKAALDLALLEDFDHLYRYADLLEVDAGVHAERLVGGYTEIMPGRPTISEHRFPTDGIPAPLPDDAPLFDQLAACIITAAEQQTMNYYMNVTGLYANDLGRQLYQEIAMIEEQHVTQYGALMNPHLTWLQCLLMHEYTECYLYWSCEQTETDERVRAIWARHFEQELGHLHQAAELLERFEGLHWQQVLPQAEFPEPLRLESNIAYVRSALNSVQLTWKDNELTPVQQLAADDPFFTYQRQVHRPIDQDAAHATVCRVIERNGQDVRFETAPHPVKPLQDRTKDSVSVGRDSGLPGYIEVRSEARTPVASKGR